MDILPFPAYIFVLQLSTLSSFRHGRSDILCIPLRRRLWDSLRPAVDESVLRSATVAGGAEPTSGGCQSVERRMNCQKPGWWDWTAQIHNDHSRGWKAQLVTQANNHQCWWCNTYDLCRSMCSVEEHLFWYRNLLILSNSYSFFHYLNRLDLP